MERSSSFSEDGEGSRALSTSVSEKFGKEGDVEDINMEGKQMDTDSSNKLLTLLFYGSEEQEIVGNSSRDKNVCKGWEENVGNGWEGNLSWRSPLSSGGSKPRGIDFRNLKGDMELVNRDVSLSSKSDSKSFEDYGFKRGEEVSGEVVMEVNTVAKWRRGRPDIVSPKGRQGGVKEEDGGQGEKEGLWERKEYEGKFYDGGKRRRDGKDKNAEPVNKRLNVDKLEKVEKDSFLLLDSSGGAAARGGGGGGGGGGEGVGIGVSRGKDVQIEISQETCLELRLGRDLRHGNVFLKHWENAKQSNSSGGKILFTRDFEPDLELGLSLGGMISSSPGTPWRLENQNQNEKEKENKNLSEKEIRNRNENRNEGEKEKEKGKKWKETEEEEEEEQGCEKEKGKEKVKEGEKSSPVIGREEVHTEQTKHGDDCQGEIVEEKDVPRRTGSGSTAWLARHAREKRGSEERERTDILQRSTQETNEISSRDSVSQFNSNTIPKSTADVPEDLSQNLGFSTREFGNALLANRQERSNWGGVFFGTNLNDSPHGLTPTTPAPLAATFMRPDFSPSPRAPLGVNRGTEKGKGISKGNNISMSGDSPRIVLGGKHKSFLVTGESPNSANLKTSLPGCPTSGPKSTPSRKRGTPLVFNSQNGMGWPIKSDVMVDGTVSSMQEIDHHHRSLNETKNVGSDVRNDSVWSSKSATLVPQDPFQVNFSRLQPTLSNSSRNECLLPPREESGAWPIIMGRSPAVNTQCHTAVVLTGVHNSLSSSEVVAEVLPSTNHEGTFPPSEMARQTEKAIDVMARVARFQVQAAMEGELKKSVNNLQIVGGSVQESTNLGKNSAVVSSFLEGSTIGNNHRNSFKIPHPSVSLSGGKVNHGNIDTKNQ